MTKKTLTSLLLIFFTVNVFAQWNPSTDKIRTKWAEEVSPDKVLPEYPRPILERTQWSNLNGLWDYAIVPADSNEPEKFDGKILVPFAVESNLSGVQKTLGRSNELWYKRTFTVPASWKGKSVMLNFGAVDWKAEVFVNDIKIGEHTGGFTPFSFDITPYLKQGEQKLVVKVWDPVDEAGSEQPRGKQVSKPGGIMYTSVSGIWQTVWLEPVSKKYVANINTVADIDAKKLKVKVCVANAAPGDVVEVTLKDGAKIVASSKFAAGQEVSLPVPDQKLWSPKSPFLYDLEINLYENGKLQDKVKSYTAMRKISIARNRNDKIVRMQLNNEDLFQFGPLDQGWWPDGLYTAPTDEALAYDVQKTKDFGFNMIRKHVKVEPARWYTHCDRIGILVWQDMPSGGHGPQFQHAKYFTGVEAVRSTESENNFRKEWKEIIDFLKPNPSVVVWVPFNESWGQFKTPEITKWTKDYDPSRLVNPASGGNNYPNIGDMLDVHNYPEPAILLYDTKRANVLGEYGGIGWPVKGHLWQPDQNWGYVQFESSKEVTDKYIEYAELLKTLVPRGFCAAVYTQTTDVEGEVNGLMTYDRKVIKLEEDRLKKVNDELCNSLNK